MKGPGWSHPEVSRFFEDAGCTLLTPEYTGCNQLLLYRCTCGAESEIRFRIFKWKVMKGIRRGCSTCQTAKMMETTLAKNEGLHHFQTAKFLRLREQTNLERFGVTSPLQNEAVKHKRQATVEKRYGVSSVSQVPEIQERQKQGFREKYGVNHFMQHPEMLAKYRKTLEERYGAPSLAFLSRRTSEESRIFFEALFMRLSPKWHEKCYFSPRTREFNIWFEGHYYKYDFVHSGLRKAIEYNGSRFHPRPEQPDDETGWCLFRPRRTVREAREYELHKLRALHERDFHVLVIWDYDAKSNLEQTLKSCLRFLLESMPGTPRTWTLSDLPSSCP